MSKTTDKDIIKTLECCKYEYDTKCELCCYNFYSRTGCRSELRRNALDLINRQQAEIERLKSMNQSKLDTIHDLQAQNEILSKNADTAFQEGLNERRDLFEPEIKAKVVKEFAERLKFRIINTPFGVNCTGENEDYKEGCLRGLVAKQNNIIDMIDTDLKEIVGEESV